MSYLRLFVATVCALALVGTGTASAAKVDTREKSNWRSSVNDLRVKVDHKFGREAGGLDILKWGIGPRAHRRPAKPDDVRDYAAVLHRYLHPPPPPPAPTQAVPSSGEGTVSSAPVSGGGGGWAIPADIVMCESGGDYGAVNPSSGAYGAYQILPSTSAGLGCDMSSPAGQDACAAKVWATQGRGAWVC